MTEKAEWTWSDGWLLMAIFLVGAERSARLHEVLAAADATNHAIPTTQELTQAFTKFVRCGLITVQGDEYAITREHIPAIKMAYGARGGLFASGDKGLKFLKRSRFVPKNDQLVTLTERQVRCAYESYVRTMRKR